MFPIIPAGLILREIFFNEQIIFEIVLKINFLKSSYWINFYFGCMYDLSKNFFETGKE